MSKVIWFSYASLLLLGWLDNVRSPFFFDIIEDLRLSGTQGALFFAVASLFAFAISFTGSYWLRKYSSLEILQFSLGLLGVGFFLISRAGGFSSLLIFSAVFGLAYGALSFAQNIVIQQYAPAALKRRIFTGLHSMYATAALFAPLSASLFLDLGLGWRRAFLVLSALPLILAVISKRIFPGIAVEPAVAEEALRPADIPRVSFWLAGLSVAFYMFGEISVSTRLVYWLRSEYNVAPEVANHYLAIFFVLLLAGRLAFTVFDFSKFSNARVLLTSASLSLLILVFALLQHPFWMAAAGLTMAPFYPVAMNYLSEIFGREHAARTLSFGIALCMLMSVVLQVTLGVLTDAFGLHGALWIAPFGMLIVVILLILQSHRLFTSSLSS